MNEWMDVYLEILNTRKTLHLAANVLKLTLSWNPKSAPLIPTSSEQL